MLAEGKNATIILVGAGVVFLVLMGALLMAGIEEANYIGSPVNTMAAPVAGTVTVSEGTLSSGTPGATQSTTPLATATP